MCKYCENEDISMPTDSAESYSTLNGNTLVTGTNGNDNIETFIEYCPMCGRKLTESV